VVDGVDEEGEAEDVGEQDEFLFGTVNVRLGMLCKGFAVRP
jgi:hypothetical protein